MCELIINLCEDGGYNHQYKKRVHDNCKYLNTDDVVAIGYDEFIINNKRIHENSGTIYLIVNYEVDPVLGIEAAKEHFLRNGFVAM